MWNDRDLDEQYMPDHLMNHHVLKPREQNGLDHGGGHHLDHGGHHPASLDHMESNRLMGHVDMMDPMLGHIGDQVDIVKSAGSYIGIGRLPGLPWCTSPLPTPPQTMYGMLKFNA